MPGGSNHGDHIGPVPVPAVVRKVISITKGEGEMDEADKALAALGYAPVSYYLLPPNCE